MTEELFMVRCQWTILNSEISLHAVSQCQDFYLLVTWDCLDDVFAWEMDLVAFTGSAQLTSPIETRISVAKQGSC